MSDYEYHIIPTLSDNYIFILRDLVNDLTICIDPATSEDVIKFLSKKNLKLDYILNTHHHFDHVGGNTNLQQKYNCPIYALAEDSHRIPNITNKIKADDELEIGIFNFKVLFIPGHTLGHIAYYEPKYELLFCGDTIFSSGCGRIFEGNPEMMFESINKLANLPETTLMFSAHEYTQANIEFALLYEPNNQDLKEKSIQVNNLRQANKPSIPTFLKDELLTNPFLRSHSKEIRANLNFNSDHLSIKIFSKLRKLKDQF